MLSARPCQLEETNVPDVKRPTTDPVEIDAMRRELAEVSSKIRWIPAGTNVMPPAEEAERLSKRAQELSLRIEEAQSARERRRDEREEALLATNGRMARAAVIAAWATAVAAIASAIAAWQSVAGK
jgi:hypothetical protein